MQQPGIWNDRPNIGQNIKLPLYEIINVEDGPIQAPSAQQENMISDMAFQCASFLNWAANPETSSSLPEILWKNQMRIKASDLYPELDNDQIKKLVDRDWRVMNEQQRKKIIQRYSKPVSEKQIKNRIDYMKDRLAAIRDSLGE